MRNSYLNEICVLLAGRAAEEVLLDDVGDGAGGAAGSDLHRATDLATLMEAAFGMGHSLLYSVAGSVQELAKLRRTDPILRSRVEELLSVEFVRSKEIVRRRRGDIEKLVAALLESEVLDGDQVRSLLERGPDDPGAPS
jgi:ATP-dependent Zn protease